MRSINFAKRNFKEIIRDPLSIIFSVLLPLFLLFIFQQFKIPNEVYNIENFTPGIIVFSLAFVTLFTAALVASDRSTSLLVRLCASPMKAMEYILGYMLAILPMVVIQDVLFFGAAMLLGLKFSINIVFAMLISMGESILFIAAGILIGCLTSSRSASGVSSIMVQLVAFTSGMWFSVGMVGEVFGIICKALPFKHGLDLLKGVLNGGFENLGLTLAVYLGYTLLFVVLAVVVFRERMKKDK